MGWKGREEEMSGWRGSDSGKERWGWRERGKERGGGTGGIRARKNGWMNGLIHVREDKKLILLVVDCSLVQGTAKALVERRHDCLTRRVHRGAIEVGAGLPGDEDGGFPQEGEDIAETLGCAKGGPKSVGLGVELGGLGHPGHGVRALAGRRHGKLRGVCARAASRDSQNAGPLYSGA